MLLKQNTIKQVSLWIVEVEGHSEARIAGLTRHQVAELYKRRVYLRSFSFAPTYNTKRGKVEYPKGHTFDPTHYNTILSYLQGN